MADNSRINRFLKVTGYVIFLILIVEVGCYFIFHSSLMDKFSNGKRIVDISSKGNSDIPASIIPHPYMLYANNPNFQVNGVKQYNSLGCRNAEFSSEKDSNEYRVLCLGGSTTNCYPYILDSKDAWPALLQQKLGSAFPEKKFLVINAGLPFGSSAEELAGYMFRYRYFNADMVIMHTGGNDIVPLFYENYNTEYTHWRSHGSGIEPRPCERVLLHSNFFKILYTVWLNKQQTVFNTYPEDIAGLSGGDVLKRVEQQNPVGFVRNLSALIEMIKADKAVPVLVNFVQAKEDNLSKNQPFLKGKEAAQQLGYNKVIEAMKEVSKADSVGYIKLDAAQFAEDMFIDNCHLSKEGEKVKAELIFKGILEKGLLTGIK